MATWTVPERNRLTGKLSAVLVLLGISVFINYIDRGNLSIAAPMLKDELAISPAQLGMLLSAFFWTYACLQPVSGWLVDRLNVNWVIAGGFFLWSAATAGTGIVCTFSMPVCLAVDPRHRGISCSSLLLEDHRAAFLRGASRSCQFGHHCRNGAGTGIRHADRRDLHQCGARKLR